MQITINLPNPHCCYECPCNVEKAGAWGEGAENTCILEYWDIRTDDVWFDTRTKNLLGTTPKNQIIALADSNKKFMKYTILRPQKCIDEHGW